MTSQLKAALRVCASCEWIFRRLFGDCPKCGFGHYGARVVFGNKVYRFAKNQQPWIDRKVADYTDKLMKEVSNNTEKKGEYYGL